MIVLGVAVLVLAVAVVVLFAMYSELAARIPAEPSAPVTAAEVSAARLGSRVSWPAELDGMADATEALVIALSTTCASCEVVASQVRLLPARAEELALIVASGDVVRAADYVNRHELHAYPYYVDVGGKWLQRTLGVESSPVAIRVQHGIPQKAVAFGDLGAIREFYPAVRQRTEVEV